MMLKEYIKATVKSWIFAIDKIYNFIAETLVETEERRNNKRK